MKPKRKKEVVAPGGVTVYHYPEQLTALIVFLEVVEDLVRAAIPATLIEGLPPARFVPIEKLEVKRRWSARFGFPMTIWHDKRYTESFRHGFDVGLIAYLQKELMKVAVMGGVWMIDRDAFLREIQSVGSAKTLAERWYHLRPAVERQKKLQKRENGPNVLDIARGR